MVRFVKLNFSFRSQQLIQNELRSPEAGSKDQTCQLLFRNLDLGRRLRRKNRLFLISVQEELIMAALLLALEI